MAKKRKRQDEIKEEREYKPPEFDRREYVKTEMGVSKATILAAAFSIPMSLAAIFVMPVGGVEGGLLTGLAGIFILWFLLPRIGIDVLPFKPMQWASIMGTYFLVFLTLWVVLCNPPFSDMASPEIQKIQVGWVEDSGNVTWANVTAIELDGSLYISMPQSNVTGLRIRARVTDNVAVEPGSVRISMNNTEPVVMMPLQPENAHAYEAVFPTVKAGDSFTIMANDVNGHSAERIFFIRQG